jgi:hypothetical protein
MLGKTFRPWGRLNWVLSKLPSLEWSFLGSVNTEDRSLTIWESLASRIGNKNASLLVQIDDVPSRFTAQAESLRAKQVQRLSTTGMPSLGVQELDLFCLEEEIVGTIDKFIDLAQPNIILDITSLPKRFFFPFVHRVLSSAKVLNLLITYTSPESYYHGSLAEDHKGLAPLPLFRTRQLPEEKVDLVTIGVGFMPLGLGEFLEKYKHDVKIRTLFPFPPGPPGFQRNWRFINTLRRDYPTAVKDPVRVAAHDVSDIFDHINKFTEGGNLRSEFGPFGPKPMSLAMCLFARQTRSVVRYTQPSFYHPLYTTGVRFLDGEPLMNCYCVRLNGVDKYLPQKID